MFAIKLKSFLDTKVTILGDGILGTELNKLTGWKVLSRKKNNFLVDLFDKYLLNVKGTIVNCIANTDTYSNDKSSHYYINFLFPLALSEFCNKNKIKLVHISTEFVYAGNKPSAKESDLPIPHNSYYAKFKLLADQYINTLYPQFLICRLLHKPNPFPHKEVWRVKTSGDTVNKIAPLLINLIEKNASGIINVGTGNKCLSKLAPTSKIITPPPHIPTNTTMNLTKLKYYLK